MLSFNNPDVTLDLQASSGSSLAVIKVGYLCRAVHLLLLSLLYLQLMRDLLYCFVIHANGEGPSIAIALRFFSSLALC